MQYKQYILCLRKNLLATYRSCELGYLVELWTLVIPSLIWLKILIYLAMALPHIKMHHEPQLITKARESSCKQRLLPFNKTVIKKRHEIEKACASASTLSTFPLKRKSSPPFLAYYSIKKLDAFNYHSLVSTNQNYGRLYSYFFSPSSFSSISKRVP